ncbi:hypothetical protein PF005_g30224 [Phytophthora fragariae]|uniref:Uncharacterized protein n=1 Tax=Phytophthora fragariae TaxID=53985 RepID=A0A6A3VJX2_9STRA|nr:hypothetical protein PF003_g25322 [Phytophthora fragariae]KAE8962478.1 hypothetical protein PF011_g29376 [Phytophthora fragariae]KAE9061268.1 hypothetical protein PF010_g29880 [Phytophthora fragariae]KAE9066365.1 hypothetical protein PF007_g28503 [Phytophthora fragariae]KAE9163967.1 hypothetical protein PF005_g30224 [Phytophthora fragariae]
MSRAGGLGNFRMNLVIGSSTTNTGSGLRAAISWRSSGVSISQCEIARAPRSAAMVPYCMGCISSPWELISSQSFLPASEMRPVSSCLNTPFSQNTSINSGEMVPPSLTYTNAGICLLTMSPVSAEAD